MNHFVGFEDLPLLRQQATKGQDLSSWVNIFFFLFGHALNHRGIKMSLNIDRYAHEYGGQNLT